MFSEEEWFKRSVPFVSFGKLRGSYGTSGSDGGKPYGYITRWAVSGIPYNGVIPLALTTHVDSDDRIHRSIVRGSKQWGRAE